MTNNLRNVFHNLARILGVCPCCGDLFYLSEVRPYRADRPPHSIIDALRAAERRLEREESKLDEIEALLREKAATAGLRTAKRLLKKIDPVFSGAGYDPQDVKVIFDPVSYVVFNGMSRGAVRDIVLLANPPSNNSAERVHSSIRKAVQRGNIEFRTLRVDGDGKVTHG